MDNKVFLYQKFELQCIWNKQFIVFETVWLYFLNILYSYVLTIYVNYIKIIQQLSKYMKVNKITDWKEKHFGAISIQSACKEGKY